MANRPDQIVFLIHGMGSYEKDWHLSWTKVLEDAYNRYPLLQRKAFADRFEFVPITYDKFFKKLVKSWQDNASALAAAGIGGLGEDLTNWLSDAGELNDNFKWTHAADVLLFKLFDLVHENICAFVAGEIKKALKAAGPGSTWSAIGHSLGTAALHDSITRLWANESIWARDHRARVIAMVANVSRVLEQKDGLAQGVIGDVLMSPVRPGVACNYFLNLEHQLDPFIWPRRFHPVGWPDAATLAANPPRYIHSADPDIRNRNYVLDHIHSEDIHSFEHYLVSPKAHIPLFRMLLAEDDFIPPEDEQRNRDQFSRFGPLQEQAAIRIKKELESIATSEGLSWEKFGSIWSALKKIPGA